MIQHFVLIWKEFSFQALATKLQHYECNKIHHNQCIHVVEILTNFKLSDTVSFAEDNANIAKCRCELMSIVYYCYNKTIT